MIDHVWSKHIVRVLFMKVDPRIVDWFFAFIVMAVILGVYTVMMFKYIEVKYNSHEHTHPGWVCCHSCGHTHYCMPKTQNAELDSENSPPVEKKK